jgi:nucleotide-binding universal stress UspA family protein
MQPFKIILVVIEAAQTEQPLIELAVELARANEGQITLVDIVPELNWPQRILLKNADQIAEDMRHEKNEQLRSHVARLRDQGIPVKSQVLQGRSSLEVIRQVLRNKHDLVLKAAKGSHSRRIGFLGTTAIELLAKCPCAVWLANSGGPVRPSRLLAAVDATPHDAEHAELNVRILEASNGISRLAGARLDVIHVWNFLGERFVRDYMQRADFRLFEESLQCEHAENFGRLVRTIGLQEDSNQVHLLRGEPSAEIPLFVRDNKIDLLVMGTIARRGVTGLLIGNTADLVVNQVACSILALKPHGFQSPIKI